jgi:hypothetical protein
MTEGRDERMTVLRDALVAWLYEPPAPPWPGVAWHFAHGGMRILDEGGDYQYTTWEIAVPPAHWGEMPDVESVVSPWNALGYRVTRDARWLYHTKMADVRGSAVQEMWQGQMVLQRSRGMCRVSLFLSARRDPPDPWRVIARAEWAGERIAGGPGLRSRLQAAAEMMRRDLAGCPAIITAIIPYASRGGRGGWKDVTAWHRIEIPGPAPTSAG